jgi:uncharacterized protein (TIRG00374 family)
MSLPASASATEPKADASRARRLLLLLLKVGVAGVAIGWLLRAKALDFGAVRLLVSSPTLFVLNLGAWFVCSVVLVTTRWRLLLRIAGVELPIARATGLQLMALFFNVVTPGNVGGDVVKMLYVARDQKPEARTSLLLLVIVERLLGLVGLVFMAAIAMLVSAPTLLQMPGVRPMLITVGLLAAGGVAGPLVLAALLRYLGPRADDWASGPSKFARLLGQLLSAARLVFQKPRLLLTALAVSMSMHAVAMAYFTVLTRVIGGHAIDFGAVAAVFPLGLLTTVLPISPGGVGVGHMAFDRLYAAIGLSGGATIFNVFLIGQIVPMVCGVIPYVTMRGQASADRDG